MIPFQTQSVAKAVSEARFKDAVELRGKSFMNNLEIYRTLNNRHVPEEATSVIEGKVRKLKSIIAINPLSIALEWSVKQFVAVCVFF